MVKWICVEYATNRMEWKAAILGDEEGNKCQPLVSRSWRSIYLCFLFGALFHWSSPYPEPGTFPCLQTRSSHRAGLQDPSFNSKQSLKRISDYSCCCYSRSRCSKDRKKCLQRPFGFARAYLGGWPLNTSVMLRHLCTDSGSCCWSGLVGTSRSVKKLSK